MPFLVQNINIFHLLRLIVHYNLGSHIREREPRGIRKMKKEEKKFKAALEEFVMLGKIAPPEILTQMTDEVCKGAIKSAKKIPKNKLGMMQDNPEQIIDLVLCSELSKKVENIVNAMAQLEGPKFKLLQLIYLKNKSPFKIFAEGNAPEGLKKKSSYLAAVKELKEQNLLTLNRGRHIVNTQLIDRKFNIDSKKLFKTKFDKDGRLIVGGF